MNNIIIYNQMDFFVHAIICHIYMSNFSNLISLDNYFLKRKPIKINQPA